MECTLSILSLLVRSHVLLQESFSEVGLVTELTFEWSLSVVFVLPHVVVKITFCHKFLLANFTTVWFLSLMLYPEKIDNHLCLCASLKLLFT